MCDVRTCDVCGIHDRFTWRAPMLVRAIVRCRSRRARRRYPSSHVRTRRSLLSSHIARASHRKRSLVEAFNWWVMGSASHCLFVFIRTVEFALSPKMHNQCLLYKLMGGTHLVSLPRSNSPLRAGPHNGTRSLHDNQMTRSWLSVPCENPLAAPTPRALHACAVRNDCIYVFGGYDGVNRLNDFYEFNVTSKLWSVVPASGLVPSPRDRHVAVVHKHSLYVFAGFGGSPLARLNDFMEYNFLTQKWTEVVVSAGTPPTPRHSLSAVVYGNSMYCFGGYDGSYHNDLHEFNFDTGTWTLTTTTGQVPRLRYRSSLVVYENTCILFGGHDGSRHLNDVQVFNFALRTWSTLVAEGPAPIPRDSHVAIVHANSMYIFGGSSTGPLSDLHELTLDPSQNSQWRVVQYEGLAPDQRFCHAAAVYDASLVVFGGYDGNRRLNDLTQFRLDGHELELLVSDLPTP